MERLRVCVVAAFEPLRVGLARSIGAAPDMEVVTEAASLSELTPWPSLADANVVVVDADVMQGMAGRAAYVQLHKRLPDLNVLFLGSRADARALGPDDIPAYMRLRTVGFLLKDGGSARLISGIRLVARGAFVCEMELMRRILTRLAQWASYDEDNAGQLSERESQVLALLAKGYSNREVAEEMFLSEGMVKAHVSHIMGKLGAERRTDLVRLAVSRGLVPLDQLAAEEGGEQLEGRASQ